MPHRRRRRAAPLEDATGIVLRALSQAGLTDQARRLHIARLWSQAVGAQIAARTCVQSFSRGTLVVKAASAAWQNELNFLKKDIMQRLNALLERPTVRELRVVGGLVPVAKPLRPKARRRSLPQPSPQHLAAAQCLAAPIADAPSRDAFSRLLLKHWMAHTPVAP